MENRTPKSKTSGESLRQTARKLPSSKTRSVRRHNGAEKKPHSDKLSFKEKLILQFIVCGGFMLVLMIINLTNAGFAAKFGAGLKSLITNNASIGSVGDSVGAVYDRIAALGDNIKSVLGLSDSGDKPEDEPVFIDMTDGGDDINGLIDSDDFRIDEDVLNRFNAPDAYIENNSPDSWAGD